MKSFFSIFKWSLVVSGIALVIGFIYGGWQAAVLVTLLGIMEVSLSFDNAIVNARVLEKMNEFWRKIFLTVGIVIAVVGMRLVAPLVVVSLTTGLNFVQVITLALKKGNPETVGTYGHYLHDAHPMIAAFGGMFLLLLFLDFIFSENEIKWLVWLEKPLARVGRLESASYLVALAALAGASFLDTKHQVSILIAGILGALIYIGVNGVGSLFEGNEDEDEETPGIAGGAEAIEKSMGVSGPAGLTKVVGKYAFFTFIYLEVLDASFSFDGVIGAFAITADPIIIALGLGCIGAVFVRSITIFLVRKGTLNDYVYLDHGAHWAIGALAGILLVSIGVDIPEIATGLIGVVLIVAAFISSIERNRREAGDDNLIKAMNSSVKRFVHKFNKKSELIK